MPNNFGGDQQDPEYMTEREYKKVRMTKLKRQRLAAKIAKEKIAQVFPDPQSGITGTVQIDAGGGAWVHCMVFVPPVDIDERAAREDK